MFTAFFQRRFVLMQCIGLLLSAGNAFGQGDSAAVPKKKPEEHYGHQLRFGIDISRPVINLAQETRRSYEAEVDYYWRKELYLVGEAGFGSASYDYADLSYKSSNPFFRIGVDRTLIARLGPGDWDAAFIGARYAAAFINRGEASYLIVDSVWGTTSGSIPAKAFTAHWAELTGGIRVELIQGLFAGWNLRGRFLLNQRSFRDLAPVFIAGFGRGDKSTVFDFNFYLCYAFRWGRERTQSKTD